MKKIFMACLVIFFCLNFLFAHTLLETRASSKAILAQGDTEKLLKKKLECGEIGQKCCEKAIDIPKFRFPRPDVPVLDKIIGILVTPIEQLFSLGDPLFNWAEDKLTNILDRPPCTEGVASGTRKSETCICVKKEAFNIGKLCTGIESTRERQKCVNCSTHGVWTALGCIDFKLGGFVNDLFGFGVGVAGGAAFLCILYTAILLQTSRGNPERIKKAREYLTNCIIGLLLIIFSVFILRLIGVNILRLPGFGG